MKNRLQRFLSIGLLGMTMVGCGGEVAATPIITECGPGQPLVLSDGFTVFEESRGQGTRAATLDVTHVGSQNIVYINQDGSFFSVTTKDSVTAKLAPRYEGQLEIGEWGSYEKLDTTASTKSEIGFEIVADYDLEPPPEELFLDSVELCRDAGGVFWMRRNPAERK